MEKYIDADQAREINPEAQDLVDTVEHGLVEACFFEQPNSAQARHVLETLAASLSTKFTVNLRGEGGRIETVVLKMGDIMFGGIRVEDFFTKVLGIEEILGFITDNKFGSRSFYDFYGSVFVQRVFSFTIERCELTYSDLPHAAKFYRNIETFHLWLEEQFSLGNIRNIIDLFPYFTEGEVQRLGLTLGYLYRDNPKYVIDLYQDVISKPRYQSIRYNLAHFFGHAQSAVNSWGEYDAFQTTIEARAGVEPEGSATYVQAVYDLTEKIIFEDFRKIINAFPRNRKISFDTRESLYLRRLGILALSISRTRIKGEDALEAVVELEDGFTFTINYSEQEEDDNGITAFAEFFGFSISRAQQFFVGVAACVIDTSRLLSSDRDMLYQAGQVLLRSLTAKKRGKRSGISIVDVSRVLLAGHGFVNPLIPETTAAIESLLQVEKQGWCAVVRRYIRGEGIDIIDPETAEVSRQYTYLSYPYVQIGAEDDSGIVVPEINPQAMYFDASQDLTHHMHIGMQFNTLSLDRDWNTLVEGLMNLSSLGALEIGVLPKL